MSPAGLESGDEVLARSFARHAAAFRERFGGAGPPRQFFSPGRVNLMGAHLDYNGGPVMPTAIDRGTFVAVRPRADSRVVMASTFDPAVLEVDLTDLPRERRGVWADYPLGVLVELARRAAAAPAAGVEFLFGGDLAIGAGLSSSASICVGTALALDVVWELGLEPLERVHAALDAERGFVGVQCGIMDPYAVGLARPGHLLWLDCKDARSTHLPFDFDGFALAVADSGVRRELAEGAFNRRVAECRAAFEVLRRVQPAATCLRDVAYATLEDQRGELDATVARRAEHVLREVARTFSARDALLAGHPAGLGVEMTRSHASLRDLYEVSCPELDQIVEDSIAVEGVLGARLTGAGFGGCAVILLRKGAEEELRARLAAGFERRFGRVPPVELYTGDRGPREIEVG